MQHTSHCGNCYGLALTTLKDSLEDFRVSKSRKASKVELLSGLMVGSLMVYCLPLTRLFHNLSRVKRRNSFVSFNHLQPHPAKRELLAMDLSNVR